jgi:hypothetical protein
VKDGNSTKAWVGNQYFDSKKKRWIQGEKPKRITAKRWLCLWNVLVFVLISVIITIILDYFSPGTKFIIFGW